MKSYIPSFKKIYTFNWKGIYFFIKRYILFNEKVYTFFRKYTVVFLKGAIVSFKKYYPFIKKVLSFYRKSTIVLQKTAIVFHGSSHHVWENGASSPEKQPPVIYNKVLIIRKPHYWFMSIKAPVCANNLIFACRCCVSVIPLQRLKETKRHFRINIKSITGPKRKGSTNKER